VAREQLGRASIHSCIAAGRDLSRFASQYDGMNILRLMHVLVAQAFYRWALREMNPLDPDLPRIVLREHELADEARRLHS
jgi:hypothetical protein